MNSDAIERAPRQSNLELLRILAIFAILGDHYFGGTGLRSELQGVSLLVANLLSSGGCISVNVFVLIGVWFLVDVPFNGMRPIRLYLTLAFYSIPITLIMLLAGRQICFQHILQGFFPFTLMATWYTNAYISLLLLTPFLKKIVNMPVPCIRNLVVLTLLLVCLPASLPWMTSYDYVSSMFWFPCVYLLVGYLKHCTRWFEMGATWVYVMMALLGYGGICVFRSSSIPQIATTAELYRACIKSLPNLVIAYCVFIIFLRLRIGTVNWINKVARSVFSVYVIHQIPALWSWEWEMVLQHLQPMAGSLPRVVAVNCLFSCAIIFVLCLLLDQVKILFLDCWLMKTRVVKRAATWVENAL